MAAPTARQAAWFCALWLAGVLALGLVAGIIRAAIGS